MLTAPSEKYTALIELLKTADTLWNSSRIFFEKWGLSPSQFNLLNILRHSKGGTTQVEISRQLIMHRSNTTGLVDRLEKRGLVCRREVPGDRRAYRVILTNQGQKLLEEILPVYYEAAEKVWGPLSTQQAVRLVSQLQQLSSRAEEIASQL